MIDTTAPTLNNIEDNDGDDTVFVNAVVSYTLTFSEDINIATIDANDFENAAVSDPVTFTVGTITEAGSNVTVPVTPRTLGNLRLRVKSNATITDEAGNQVTGLPVTDDTTLTVTLAPLITPTDVGGSMGFSYAEVNSINDSGIGTTQVGGYDTHTRDGTLCWRSANNKTNGVMTYDLGAVYNITNMVLWNYDEGNTLTNRGIREFTIQYFDTTNGLIASSGLLTAQRADVSSGRIAAQVIDIPDASNVNKIKLCISNNWGDTYCGMAELKFAGAYVKSWVNYTAPDLISPTGGVTTMGAYPNRAVANSCNRSGLTPSTGPFRSTDTHQTTANNAMWMSSSMTTGTVTYAFSNILEVSAVALWNYNEDSLRPVKDFDIQFLDGNDAQFSYINGLVARRGAGAGGGEYVYDLKTGFGVLHGPLAQSAGTVAEVFSFTPVAGVKKVRLNIRSNYGDASYTGISEFGIVGRVKPPSGALILLW